MKNIISDSGEVKIHKNSIRQIINKATFTVKGVYSPKEKKTLISSFLKKIALYKIRLDLNKEIEIELPIIVQFGYNIPDVASKVQQEILKKLSSTLNIDNAYIIVKVKGLKK